MPRYRKSSQAKELEKVDPALLKDVLVDQFGLSDRIAGQIAKRARAQAGDLGMAPQILSTGDTLKAIEEKIASALHYLDDFALSGANAQQLATVLGILIDKRQLLRGEPTQIISQDDRKSLAELLPRLLGEVDRRGMQLEGVKYTEIGGDNVPAVVKKNDTE